MHRSGHHHRTFYRLFVLSFLLLAARTGEAQPVERSGGEAAAVSTARSDTICTGIEQEAPLEWYTMISNIPGDWVRYSQATFRTTEIPAFIGMTGLTVALVMTDDETWRMSDRWYKSSPVVKSWSDIFEYMGDGRPQFGLAGAFAVYGFVAGDHRALRTASQTVEAILACGTVVQVLKHMTGRQSPFLSTRPGGVWDLFPNQIEYSKHVAKFDAYPSGHIATAMTTVTVIAENYPECTWMKPVGYTICALIGISMGNTGIHWYSDYPLGLALGYSFGMLAAHPMNSQSSAVSKSEPGGITVAPMINSEGVGLMFGVAL